METLVAVPSHRMDDGARVDLAGRAGTPPEMLFFLANDPVAEVRAAVAANAATPSVADRMLVRDPEPGVRRMLARKLASLAPMMDPCSTDRQRRVTWDTLRQLLQDEVVAVRAAVTELVAEQPDVPRALVLQLARDIAMVVAEPVLRGSPLLEEADLLELIANPPALETLTAIARRPNLRSAPSDAIVARADDLSVAALLANSTACIREATLLAIAGDCGNRPAWQAAIIRRSGLGATVCRRLTEVLAEEALRLLASRTDLDPAVLAAVHPAAPQPRSTPTRSWGMDEESFVTAARQKKVPDSARILAALSGIPAGVVTRVILARDAAPLVALCWKAGLSGRAAACAQLYLVGNAPEELLVLSGGNWAMAPETMQALVEGLVAQP